MSFGLETVSWTLIKLNTFRKFRKYYTMNIIRVCLQKENYIHKSLILLFSISDWSKVAFADMEFLEGFNNATVFLSVLTTLYLCLRLSNF